jgi:hypothetical protein
VPDSIGPFEITLTCAGPSGPSSDTTAFTIISLDTDEDSVANATDNCPDHANSDQIDSDGDLSGEVCDGDDDNDGVPDGKDAFPLDSTESIDTDSDGTGNNADPDDDNDGLTDDSEINIYGTNPLKRATDGDGLDDRQEIELGLDPLDPEDCPYNLCPPPGSVLKLIIEVLSRGDN